MCAGLDVKYNKRGDGFVAKCRHCGKTMRRASGCNRSGLGYALAGATEDFKKHFEKCRKAVT